MLGETTVADLFNLPRVSISDPAANAARVSLNNLLMWQLPQPTPAAPAPSTSGTITDWLKENSTVVYVSAAALIALALFGRRR